MGLCEPQRLVSHVASPSGSAAHPPSAQGRAPPPSCPSLASGSSLSQSMLTKWLCRSDNSLGPGRLRSQSYWRPRPLGTVPPCHTQAQAVSCSIPPPQPGPARRGWASLCGPHCRCLGSTCLLWVSTCHTDCPRVSCCSPIPQASSPRIFASSVSGEGGTFILDAQVRPSESRQPLSLTSYPICWESCGLNFRMPPESPHVSQPPPQPGPPASLTWQLP